MAEGGAMPHSQDDKGPAPPIGLDALREDPPVLEGEILPPSSRLPSFTPFVAVAVVLVLAWAALWLSTPKNQPVRHLHLCATGSTQSGTGICVE
ncbi:hypothetical protein ACI01nite_20790 [Acetobacter cibinongensis]|uniref:Uncharacterized protein n=1 Tax=Acetobacter cibinongensis TaxID=146475 RepID=A0A0D6N0G4_9PROT|nr:hypothetical protein [Acetobacter cibinongensis]GAN59492.1 hypothetical protein Abci_005_086 [Acetobacter cibinongensis]GBQ12535.1 hypothetical protein AA0482_0287 [Acetobacter cibinongensis NRIC 0482]GEL59477.1 hypothetical protein ACI01nite_20790 [Acetobacter cibinongensis]